MNVISLALHVFDSSIDNKRREREKNLVHVKALIITWRDLFFFMLDFSIKASSMQHREFYK